MTITLPETCFSAAEIKAFQPAMKIGMLATVTPEGLPHITLISSLMAAAPAMVNFGQFIEGRSKQHLRQNPRAGFLIMTLEKQLWRGKATWTHSETGGPEFEWYNNVPMFRYNAYFGIHTVHYLSLVGHTGQQPLPMNSIIFSAVKTMLARAVAPKAGQPQPVMNAWTRAFFSKLDNLKFLSFVDSDGYPWIIPAIQAQAEDPAHLLLNTGVYGAELASIPPGSPVAALGMALSMEDVLVRGTYQGIEKRAGLSCARIALDWAYNPMPPAPGQIYPPVELKAVEEF